VQNFKNIFLEYSEDEKLIFCRSLTDSLNDESLDHLERTMKYLMMTHCCFMGSILNKDKYYFNGIELNIKNGKHFFLTDSFIENVKNVSRLLRSRKGRIDNQDYKNILKAAQKGDFVFLDPPYFEMTCKYNFQYNKKECIDQKFLLELKDECINLNKRGVLWLMTQADTPYVKEIFSEYFIESYLVYRSRTNTYKNELMIRNYKL
jgi:DNA adenine methylase